MDFSKTRPELKMAAHQCVTDAKTQMSARVASAILYAVLRIGEIIDWWFPVKVSMGNKIK